MVGMVVTGGGGASSPVFLSFEALRPRNTISVLFWPFFFLRGGAGEGGPLVYLQATLGLLDHIF